MTQPPFGQSQPQQPYQPQQPDPTQSYPTQPGGYPTQSGGYPTQPGGYPPQGYPADPAQGYPPTQPQAFGAYPQGGIPPQGVTPPQGGYQQPWGAQMPMPEQKKPFPLLPVLIGAIVLVAAIALVLYFVVFKEDDPVPPPPAQTSQTTSEAPPPSESATPTEEPSPTQSATTAPTGDLGLVTLNDTFTDADVSVTVTILRVGTVWIPAIDNFGPDEGSPYVSMLGMEISADASQSPYMAMVPTGSNFELIPPNGGDSVRCTDVLESDEYLQYSEAIIDAISGDPAAPARTTNYDTDTGSGWFVCEATEWAMENFNAAPGFTIKYTRMGGTLNDGTVIPEYTHETVVTP